MNACIHASKLNASVGCRQISICASKVFQVPAISVINANANTNGINANWQTECNYCMQTNCCQHWMQQDALHPKSFKFLQMKAYIQLN